MISDQGGTQGPEEVVAPIEGAERSLRRADLVDERSVVRASRGRHFWLTAKWLGAGAVLSALGVSLGAWDVVLSFLALGLLAVAAWVFMGANAREDMIADELRELDSVSDPTGQDST